MMTRRMVLTGMVLGFTWRVTAAHTPYQQWHVYRQRHLIILTHRADPLSYPLGKQIAAVLATHLPASQARVARAPYIERVGSLLSSKQLDVALLSRPNAVALLTGQPPFTHYGPVAIRVMVDLGAYLLVCREDFPNRHAYLVAQTLHTHQQELSPAVTSATTPSHAGDPAVPIHPGALAYGQGRPLPAEAANTP